jgi:hypothetical protein
MLIGQPVAQRWMMPGDAGECLDEGRIRRGPLDRRRRAVTDTKAQLRGSRPDGGEQGRLADSRQASDDQRSAASSGRVSQRSLGDGQFPVTAEQWVVTWGNDVARTNQPVPQCCRFASGGNAQLTLQRPGHAFELTQGRMAITVRGIALHEGKMSTLVTRV